MAQIRASPSMAASCGLVALSVILGNPWPRFAAHPGAGIRHRALGGIGCARASSRAQLTAAQQTAARRIRLI